MFTVRPYRREDLPRLRELTVICFDGISIDQNIERQLGVVGGIGWQERKAAHVEDDCAVHPQGVFVAEVEVEGRREVVGYISSRPNRSPRVGWVANLGVDPRFRRRGIARALFARAFAYLKQCGMVGVRIETLEQNEVGAQLYPRLGFREVARQIHYYRPLDEEPGGADG